jgi:hypothetical protein
MHVHVVVSVSLPFLTFAYILLLMPDSSITGAAIVWLFIHAKFHERLDHVNVASTKGSNSRPFVKKN